MYALALERMKNLHVKLNTQSIDFHEQDRNPEAVELDTS